MKVYAHRGYSGKYPENTMLAFQKAAEVGCDGIELDVQLTKDGVPVIIHDEAIDRTTDGAGFVRDYTCAELSKFNAGSVCGGAYGFQPIPSFEEYCKWVSQAGLVTNVELKSGVYYYAELEEKVMELVRRYGLTDKVLYSSFNHSSLVQIKKLDSTRYCGALVPHEGLGNAGYYCKKNGFEAYHPGVKGLTEDTVKDCRENGIDVNVWTVNSMGDLERLYEWGCDGIFTNYPEVCRAWLAGKK